MIQFDDCAYFSNGLVKNHQLDFPWVAGSTLLDDQLIKPQYQEVIVYHI